MKKIFIILSLFFVLIATKDTVHAANTIQNDLLNETNQYLCYADFNNLSDNEFISLLDDDDYNDTTYQSSTPIFLIVFLLVYAIQGVIFGYATSKIIENKGYDENWFWWGFFFGLIALLVALSKPELHRYEQQSILTEVAQETHKKHTLTNGGWECVFCHSINENYITTCACGKSKTDTEEFIKKKKAKEQESILKQEKYNMISNEINTIELIEKYKKLLDSGAITQEEFEKKKQSLL